MGSEKGFKIIGLAATIIGMGLTLVTNWVDDKKLDSKIEKEVAKAFAKKSKE